MNNKLPNRFLHIDQLSAGDVLLCYKDAKIDPVGKLIIKVTNSKYTHSAIYLGNKEVIESVTSGIQKISIDEIVSRYDHIAVFRQPDWNEDRIKALKLFSDKVLSDGTRYNFSGILKFNINKRQHAQSIYDKLTKFFEENPPSRQPPMSNYFCSELVVDCFAVTGFLSESAQIFYQPNTYSPGDLGNDPTFGTFAGYLTVMINYCIPTTDEFYYSATYDDIFNSQL